MSARSHDRNDPWVWLSELLMAAGQAAGIPLLSRLGWHPIIQPSHTPRHRSHLAHEARHPHYPRKNHDGSLARMLNSVKSVPILSNSLPEKTAKRNGIRVLRLSESRGEFEKWFFTGVPQRFITLAKCAFLINVADHLPEISPPDYCLPKWMRVPLAGHWQRPGKATANWTKASRPVQWDNRTFCTL